MLSRRIKEARQKRNLTQKDLGELIGVTKVSICCYETGSRIPTIETLKKLAEVLKVDLTYLMGNDMYVVAEDDHEYGMNLAKEELQIIKELRKHSDLYQKLTSNPKKMLQIIEEKLYKK